MNRWLKTRHFDRWMRKTPLTDSALRLAIGEMQQGLIDADLGGGVVKKRVGLPNQGKRGGFRTLLATNKCGLWIFIFGFEKSARGNIAPQELAALRMLARDMLRWDADTLEIAIRDGSLIEIALDT
ncbi:type II toxin-antitoxin system RelE/ParE family toxin [Thiorhodovibrio frisius]|uniref:Type II toxin-antitoxin system RelE/ParE family toxin n=2 Tax=Thiorhodovibrio frisius TaxID=631362 RepID=H8Z8N1_9GAMM|nr:type II toxin-antitoxin system RelE/ParE family toxin [Thiorhodovibrio frisius]EIC19436.1 hypothetical protein Thi970DRAFT_04957 [Thiorhodovibrio frisius]